MCEFSIHLTKNLAANENKNYIQQLKTVKLYDAAILNVMLVTAYFNFVNRMLLSLGVQLEAHEGEGYKY